MNQRLMRIPEVARILELDGTEVYSLIDQQELAARKGRDGLVYVSEHAVQEYERRRRAGTPR